MRPDLGRLFPLRLPLLFPLLFPLRPPLRFPLRSPPRAFLRTCHQVSHRAVLRRCLQVALLHHRLPCSQICLLCGRTRLCLPSRRLNHCAIRPRLLLPPPSVNRPSSVRPSTLARLLLPGLQWTGTGRRMAKGHHLISGRHLASGHHLVNGSGFQAAPGRRSTQGCHPRDSVRSWQRRHPVIGRNLHHQPASERCSTPSWCPMSRRAWPGYTST